MYLYHNGNKYQCLLLKPRQSAKIAALIELLDVYNSMRIPLPFEMAFLRENPLPGVRIPVHVGRWEYLESIYLTEVNVEGSGLEERVRTSPTILKEVYKFVDDQPWVYTYEYGYSGFMSRQLNIALPDMTGIEEKSRMILVPHLWKDYNNEVFVSMDM